MHANTPGHAFALIEGGKVLWYRDYWLSAYTPWWYAKREGNDMSEITYTVPGMSCGHCTAAVSSELRDVAGVESVDVDLDTKRVTVRGADLHDAALRAAIGEAGYEAA